MRRPEPPTTDLADVKGALEEWESHGKYDWGPGSWNPHHLAEAARRWVEFIENPSAELRRRVESGTIKGEVVDVEERYNARGYYESIIDLDEPGTYLVIPVSDGGSET